MKAHLTFIRNFSALIAVGTGFIFLSLLLAAPFSRVQLVWLVITAIATTISVFSGKKDKQGRKDFYMRLRETDSCPDGARKSRSFSADEEPYPD